MAVGTHARENDENDRTNGGVFLTVAHGLGLGTLTARPRVVVVIRQPVGLHV